MSGLREYWLGWAALAMGGCLWPASGGTAQYAPGKQGSANVRILSHLPLGSGAANIEIEQELSRPYAYVSRGRPGRFDIVSVKVPARAALLYSWTIEDPELHQGSALDGRYLKVGGRYYYVQSFEFQPTGPSADLGAIVFDVTGLPDTSALKEVARIRTPEFPRGFHSIFAYKHSDGRALLVTAMPYVGPWGYIYDMARVVTGDVKGGLVGQVPRPDTIPAGGRSSKYPGYHDFLIQYDVATKRDLFYGAGLIGYYVFDITDVTQPRLVTSIRGTAGMDVAHTFTPDPTGRYAVTEMEYETAPLRIFDLKPGLDGTVKTISRPIGAWTAKWENLVHNHEVRWPYVFVSGYKDGMYVFNMMDPANPYTVGYYDTHDAPDKVQYPGAPGGGGFRSAFGVDVRNADGMIVISDGSSGFWAFHLDGFDGWNGHDWGVPNISSVQDWDNGPEGAPKPGRVS